MKILVNLLKVNIPLVAKNILQRMFKQVNNRKTHFSMDLYGTSRRRQPKCLSCALRSNRKIIERNKMPLQE